jgi:hypothetical protein
MYPTRLDSARARAALHRPDPRRCGGRRGVCSAGGVPAVQGAKLIEIPADLHPQCIPIAWLLGRWQGAGLGDYPTIEPFRMGQEISFTYVPEKTFLTYESRTWALDDEGTLGRPLATETGYWRPQPDGAIEVLLTHPTGFVEIYLGTVEPAKIELATRGVLKTGDREGLPRRSPAVRPGQRPTHVGIRNGRHGA